MRLTSTKLILAGFAVLVLGCAGGCPQDGTHTPEQNPLVGTWEQMSMRIVDDPVDHTTPCPGDIEVRPGEFVPCARALATFSADSTMTYQAASVHPVETGTYVFTDNNLSVTIDGETQQFGVTFGANNQSVTLREQEGERVTYHNFQRLLTSSGQ